MLGRQLQILAIGAAIRMLVLDAHIGKLHVPIVDGQVVRDGPLRDLFRGPIGSSGRVAIPSVVLLEEPLILALELVVQDHPLDAARHDASSASAASR